jgi:flagellar basal body-associated protein FliL
MFEEFEAEERGQKEERNKLLRMTAIIVCVVAVVGGIIYIATRGHAKPSPAAAQAAPAAQKPTVPPDPVKDLYIVRAAMGKDPSGLRVVWNVQLRNRSTVYTYSDIQYDSYFLAVDGKRLGENKDTIKDTIGPGEVKTFPPIYDGTYDSHYSTYQFILLGANSSVK